MRVKLTNGESVIFGTRHDDFGNRWIVTIDNEPSCRAFYKAEWTLEEIPPPAWEGATHAIDRNGDGWTLGPEGWHWANPGYLNNTIEPADIEKNWGPITWLVAK